VALALVVALSTAGVAACGGGDGPRPLTLHWREGDLPAPSGTRALPRAGLWCGGRWYVVGATADPAGRTRAAAWTSRDARTWQPVVLHPGGDYYAARSILRSIGCSGRRVAVLGAKSGGAHGNPRTATWRQLPDGSLAAVPASFLLFGGADAVGVGELQGGRQGYAIAGARTSGAAVWFSPTGAAFRIHEGEPGLADTRVTRTQAADVVSDGRHWVVVGTSTDVLGRLYATAWLPAGPGRWRPETLPGGHTVSTADRAIALVGGSGPVVAGVLDQRFALWLRTGGDWSVAHTFGRRDPDGTAAPYVSGLGVAGGRVLATYSDGARFRLAAIDDGEQGDLPLPTDVSVNGDHAVSIATDAEHVLLVADDGTEGRTWVALVPGGPRP